MTTTKKPRRAPTSQMSTKLMRGMGFAVAKADRYDAYARRSIDMFGMFDLVAIKEGEGIIAIQTTTLSNVPARVNKIRDNPIHVAWLKAGGRIRVHGWHKPAHRWLVRDDEITLKEDA